MSSDIRRFVALIVIVSFLLAPAGQVYAHNTAATWDQEHFRFRDDDGNESGASGYGTGDLGVDVSIGTSETFAVGQALRLRIGLLKNNNGDLSLSTTPKLQFKAAASSCTDASGWTDVPTQTGCGSSAFCLSSSANFTDGTATTRQLDASHTHVGGDMIETDGAPNSATFSTGNGTDHAEWEWMLDSDNATAGTVYTFRLVNSSGVAYTNYSQCPTLETDPVPPDLSWDTGAADFEIWESASTTWDAGTLVCSGTLTDDNGSTISCDSGTIDPSTQYRVQMVLENIGGSSVGMGAGDYVDHKNVKSGWAGTNPTLGNCAFNDFGTDDIGPACLASFNGNDARLVVDTGAVTIAAPTGTEGFSYLITTDVDAVTSSTSYLDTSIDSVTEDSSKITITITAGQPTFTQNDFEWFVTADSVTLSNIWPPGTGTDLSENAFLTQIPAPNEPLESGDRIRIQMNYTLSGATLSAAVQAFKLLYDAASDCTTASSWTSVGAKASGSIWRLFDESSIGDSTTQVNDISTSTASAEGYYSEINATGTNPNEVLVTENSEWDWPVENNGAAENTTYCFRMEKALPPQFDAANSTNGTTSPLTISSFTVGSNTDRILMCGTAARGGVTVASITWNGGAESFTKIDDNQPAGDTRVELWYLLNPTDTTANIVATFSGDQSVMVGCTSLYNVNQTTPLGTSAENNAVSADPTVDVTSAIGDLVIDVVGDQSGGSTLAVDASQTERWRIEGSNHDGGMSTEIATGTTTTMSWTNTSDTWANIGVAVKSAGLSTPFSTYNADSFPKLTTAPGTANLLRHGNIFSDGVERGFFWAN